MRKNWVIYAFALLLSLPANAQVDKREVRAGNRAFKKDEFRKSEIDYRKAVLKDSLLSPASTIWPRRFTVRRITRVLPRLWKP